MKFFFKFIVPSFFIAIFFGLVFFTPSTFKPNDYLSFSLTLLTYFYVVFTWEMLLNLKQESYLEKRPYLIADFDSQGSNLYFYLENIGKTPALDVKVSILPDIEMSNGFKIGDSIFENRIEFYPPGKKN